MSFRDDNQRNLSSAPTSKIESVKELLVVTSIAWSTTELGRLIVRQMGSCGIKHVGYEEHPLLNPLSTDKWIDMSCPIRIFRQSISSLETSPIQTLTIEFDGISYVLMPFSFHPIESETFIGMSRDGSVTSHFKDIQEHYSMLTGIYYPGHPHHCIILLAGLDRVLDASTSRTKIIRQDNVDRVQVESALVSLQIHDPNCWIVSLETVSSMAEWIVGFLHTASFLPYRENKEQRKSRTVIKGNDPRDTFQKMLTLIPGCSQSVAEAITIKYPKFHKLWEAYDGCSSTNEAELLLSNILVKRKTYTKIGDALSRVIYHSLRSDNPNRLVRVQNLL